MKDYFIQKDLIPTAFLDLAHQDICNLIDTTANLKKIGGYKSGHLNVRVGKYLKEFIDFIDQKNLTKKMEKFYGIDLQEYYFSIGMNLNLPGSISQHIHRDTIFSQREIVINIPTVKTNESNGATLVFDGSGKEPLSYLDFLLKRNEFEEAIVCTNKGDAFVRDSNMFHAGRTNHTNFIRPMFAISIRKKEPNIRYANYKNYNVIEDNEFKISYNWYKNNYFSIFMERVYYLIPFLKDLRRIIMSIVRNKDFPT